MKLLTKLKNGLVLLLDILISSMLWVLIRPLLFLFKKFFSKKIYTKINFVLISIVNYVFFYNKIHLNKLKKSLFDMRYFRDNYDREGLNLYTSMLDSDSLFRGKRILDVGCGVGGKDFEILQYDPVSVTGVDLSARNIEFAKELITSKNSKVLRFLNIDLMTIKEVSAFDTIVSYTVFEHIDKKIILEILNKMSALITEEGNILIVFNHFNDRFGSHLKEYIYHPWPQALFDEDQIFSFWNKQLTDDINITKDSYFPKDYMHGTDEHNSDCFMNLNKIDSAQFLNIIEASGLRVVKKWHYSRPSILNIAPFTNSKYLEGSAVYLLKKNQ